MRWARAGKTGEAVAQHMADATIIEFVLAGWIEALPDCQTQSVKVYPWGRAPQATATRPFVLYHRVHGGRMRSLSGPSRISHPRIQLDVVGRDYLVVRRLVAYIREQLDAFEFGSAMGDKTVQVAIAEDEFDQTDGDVRPQHGDEQTEHRATIDLSIWFVES